MAILSKLTDKETSALFYDWSFWARENQFLPTDDFRYWAIIAGRGFGKTRTGAEAIREWQAQGYKWFVIAGATAGDVRDIMVEGESGILAICPPWDRPTYEPSKQRIVWDNGAVAVTRSADKPDRFRGLQAEKAWVDELAAWRYPEAFTQLKLGLRLGDKPQAVITTTPRPTKTIRDLVQHGKTIVTTGTTYENRANLADDWYQDIITEYEGTRLGRQELLAEILTDVPGALWTYENLDRYRKTEPPVEMMRIVVAIDPAASANEDSDETGIIVAGIDNREQGYVLDDLTIKGTPDRWARVAVEAYHNYRADRIVAERNNGGDMVEYTIRTIDADVAFKSVWAAKGKHPRAEPVSALYEQGRIHHVGTFSALEDQLCQWVVGQSSPDRLDALVWAFTELMIDGRNVITIDTAPDAFADWRG